MKEDTGKGSIISTSGTSGVVGSEEGLGKAIAQRSPRKQEAKRQLDEVRRSGSEGAIAPIVSAVNEVVGRFDKLEGAAVEYLQGHIASSGDRVLAQLFNRVVQEASSDYSDLFDFSEESQEFLAEIGL